MKNNQPEHSTHKPTQSQSVQKVRHHRSIITLFLENVAICIEHKIHTQTHIHQYTYMHPYTYAQTYLLMDKYFLRLVYSHDKL